MSGTIPRMVRRAAGVGYRVQSRIWRPYSRLFLIGDVEGWVISRELEAVGEIAGRLGIPTPSSARVGYSKRQCLFFGSHFTALRRPWPGRHHRIALTYFHGLPGTRSQPGFDDDLVTLRRLGDRICRVQVSHREMETVLQEAGFPEERIFRIPIGLDLDLFPEQTQESRAEMRERFGLPAAACIVGSFQKDGVGWEEGLEPKLIKGPDVLLRVFEVLRPDVPELFVVLCGPARGYVKAGLERLAIPYRSFQFDDYGEVARLYQTLDAYLVTSRQEGGPKAVLEAMASGVPLVTTRVGQASDLVEHDANGWIVDIDDVEGLAHWTRRALGQRSSLGPLLARGRATAEANAYARQTPLWATFFEGFVEGRWR